MTITELAEMKSNEEVLHLHCGGYGIRNLTPNSQQGTIGASTENEEPGDDPGSLIVYGGPSCQLSFFIFFGWSGS